MSGTSKSIYSWWSPHSRPQSSISSRFSFVDISRKRSVELSPAFGPFLGPCQPPLSCDHCHLSEAEIYSLSRFTPFSVSDKYNKFSFLIIYSSFADCSHISLSLVLSLSLTCYLSLFHSLSLSFALTLSSFLACSLPLFPCVALSLSLSVAHLRTHTHTFKKPSRTRTLSVPLLPFLSLVVALSKIHTHLHSLSVTLSHSVSLSCI